MSHGWTGSAAGAAETALEALRGVTVEKLIDQKKKKRNCFNSSVITFKLFSEENL